MEKTGDGSGGGKWTEDYRPFLVSREIDACVLDFYIDLEEWM